VVDGGGSAAATRCARATPRVDRRPEGGAKRMWSTAVVRPPPRDASVPPPRATRRGGCAPWEGRATAAVPVGETPPREAGGAGAGDGGGSAAGLGPGESAGGMLCVGMAVAQLDGICCLVNRFFFFVSLLLVSCTQLSGVARYETLRCVPRLFHIARE